MSAKTPIKELRVNDLFLFPFREGPEEMLLLAVKDSNTGIGYEVEMTRYPRNKRYSKLVKLPYTPEGLEVEVTGHMDHKGDIHE